MKITVTMKTSDCLDNAIEGVNIDPEEFKKIASKWFQYEEYIRVQIDTDAKTCIVLKN